MLLKREASTLKIVIVDKILIKLMPKIIYISRLNNEEVELIKNSFAAKIIIATALLSRCSQKEKIIIRNLTILMAGSSRVKAFTLHRDGETIENRIAALGYYPNGKNDFIKAGMILLCLLSLNDHQHDYFDDLLKNKYNPLINQIDYESEKDRLKSQFENLPLVVQEAFAQFYIKSITNYWIR